MTRDNLYNVHSCVGATVGAIHRAAYLVTCRLTLRLSRDACRAAPLLLPFMTLRRLTTTPLSHRHLLLTTGLRNALAAHAC